MGSLCDSLDPSNPLDGPVLLENPCKIPEDPFPSARSLLIGSLCDMLDSADPPDCLVLLAGALFGTLDVDPAPPDRSVLEGMLCGILCAVGPPDR